MDERDNQLVRMEEKLERIYNDITKIELNILAEISEGKPTSTIYLYGSDGTLFYEHIDPKNKYSIEEQTKHILDSKNILAVINAMYGWENKIQNFNGDKHIKDIPGSREVFFISIESVLFKKTMLWGLKRDKEGKIVFPLETPDIINGEIGSRFTKDYFIRS